MARAKTAITKFRKVMNQREVDRDVEAEREQKAIKEAMRRARKSIGHLQVVGMEMERELRESGQSNRVGEALDLLEQARKEMQFLKERKHK